MIKVLLITLLLLMMIVGGKRGVKSFFALCVHFVLLIIAFYLIALGFNPVVISFLFCIAITFFLLYYIAGYNQKTKVSLISVFIVLFIFIIGIVLFTDSILLGGFGYESYEEINMFSYEIALPMGKITSSLILMGLIGAIIDASIAISSSVYEIYQNNPNLTRKELCKSALFVGKSILGTTINTLLFAFLGEFITLFIWFHTSSYSFGEIVNSKVFSEEFVKIMFSGLGCILIIPITAYLMSYALTRKEKIK